MTAAPAPPALPPHTRALAAGWAVIAIVAGFLFRRQAEDRHGRG